jgi:hypothetical protein
MEVEYKSIEFRLHEYLVQIQDMLTLLEADNELFAAINEKKELIKSKKYKVAVMGEFKRGKSSLINALLGLKILPADVTPTTATINRITYGSIAKVMIHYKNGEEKWIDISELSDYVTKLTPGGQARASQISEAVVLTPTVICQNNVEIIDTPGLNDDPQMTKITIDILGNVDAVILAISAKAPFSETEKMFVCQLIKSSSIHNIVFVLTYIDQLDEDEFNYESFVEFIRNRIYEGVFEQLVKDGENEIILRRAHQMLDEMNLFGVSSTLALKSFVSNDMKLLKKSKFEEFKSALLQIVTVKQVENATIKTVDTVRTVLSQVDSQYQARLNQLNQEMESISQFSCAVERYYDNTKKRLNDVFFQSYDSLTEILRHTYIFKNLLVSEFIKRLSAIKINTHQAIKSAISLASEDLCKMINEEYHIQIQTQLYDRFALDKEKLLDMRKSDLANSSDVLNLRKEQDVDFSDLLNRMMAFARDSIQGVEFRWIIEIIPNVENLANYNVIEHMIQVINISVNEYNKGLDACVNAIRKQWFLQLSADAENQKRLVQKNEMEVKDHIDSKMRAYISNYKLISENVENIIRDCDVLLQDFYKSGEEI